MEIRTELKKDYRELYDMLKQENLLDWFEKLVKINGSIDAAIDIFLYDILHNIKLIK